MFFIRLAVIGLATLAITVVACEWAFKDRSSAGQTDDRGMLEKQRDGADPEDTHQDYPLTYEHVVGLTYDELVALQKQTGSAPPAMIEPLTKALKEPNYLVREAAAWVLGKMGAKSITAIHNLDRACYDSEMSVSEIAERARERIIAKFIGSVTDEDDDELWSSDPGTKRPLNRGTGIGSNRFDSTGDQRFGGSVSLLHYPFGPVQLAIVAADKQDPDAAVKLLIEVLKDPDASVRQSAIQELGKKGDRALLAVPALTETLKDKEVDVRGAAAMALGRMGKKAKSAASGLAAILADTDRDVRCAGALALSRIGKDAKESSDVIPALVKMAKSEDKYVQVYACCALAILDEKTETHLRVLADALTDGKVEVRGSAAYVLGELGSLAKSAVPALAKALKDDDKHVRQAVARALGEMGSEAKTVVPALIDALKDAEPGVRSAVAMAIGEVGPAAKDAVPALIDALKDKEIEVRGSAVFALGEIGPAASGALTALSGVVTRDEDAEVRRAAVLAIGKIQE